MSSSLKNMQWAHVSNSRCYLFVTTSDFDPKKKGSIQAASISSKLKPRTQFESSFMNNSNCYLT